MITPEQVEAVVTLIRQRFPGWHSFADADFVAAEVAYKQTAATKAGELLGKDALRALIDRGDFDEVLSRLKTISSATNLLYLSVPRSGDNAIIAREEVDRPGVCRAIFDLLHGPEAVEDRLDAFLAFVDTNDRKWTFPTYLLFLSPRLRNLRVVAYAQAKRCHEAILIYPIQLPRPIDDWVGNIRVRSLTFALDGELEETGAALMSALMDQHTQT